MNAKCYKGTAINTITISVLISTLGKVKSCKESNLDWNGDLKDLTQCSANNSTLNMKKKQVKYLKLLNTLQTDP